VMQLKHSPEKLMDVTLMPIIFLLLFLYVFGGVVAGSTHAYLELLLPGLVGQMAMFATMSLGTALCDDIHKGVFDRFRSLPIARSAPPTPGRSTSSPLTCWPTCSTWRCAGSRC
jgi:oleandomycin transport system permease protein